MEIKASIEEICGKPQARITVWATPEECASAGMREAALVELEKRIGLIADLHLGVAHTAAFETVTIKASA